MKNNFPCTICGHGKRAHNALTSANVAKPDCLNCVGITFKEIPMHEFKPDKLKYLEQQYDKLQS